MKRKAEIRFCALGFLCLVVIVVAAMTLSETAKGIRLTEGNSQMELVTAIADVVGEAQPQVHAGIYTMTASETEMRFTDGEREIYAANCADLLHETYPQADAIYEDAIIDLVGEARLAALREMQMVESCGSIYGRKLYALR